MCRSQHHLSIVGETKEFWADLGCGYFRGPAHFTSLPNMDTPLATQILNDPKYYPYFDNCLGALDGTHISIHVPLEEQSQYCNQKGTLSQNVLAVCNFDMQFVYVLPGWEGSAHDGRVLSDAQSHHNFNTPKGKYWLGDAGYGN